MRRSQEPPAGGCRAPLHERINVRGLELGARRWGGVPEAGEAPVILLHGFQDTGGTFQCLVDACERERAFFAIDWRGFGASGWSRDGYWFPDYLADLDALADSVSPDQPLRLVGHSMGGNIACLYAGLRPRRVRSVVSIEGFGLPRTAPDQAPGRLGEWLDQVKTVPRLRTYAGFEDLAASIERRYPRFGPARSRLMAGAWGKLESDGRVHLAYDPCHRRINPVPYRREEAEAVWRGIRAPALLLLGEQSRLLAQLGADGSDEAWRGLVPQIEILRLADCGHMLHIERPEAIAPVIERFLDAH